MYHGHKQLDPMSWLNVNPNIPPKKKTEEGQPLFLWHRPPKKIAYTHKNSKTHYNYFPSAFLLWQDLYTPCGCGGMICWPTMVLCSGDKAHFDAIIHLLDAISRFILFLQASGGPRAGKAMGVSRFQRGVFRTSVGNVRCSKFFLT